MEQNYVVSARKYRPSTFESVVGQHAITHTLKTAIANQHLAQAYLFCGPRGVGKTSCARIFAKTINCEHPDTNGDACNECESCRAFNEHRSFNIVELDAASNNSVEDIRSITEQVRIPPQVGRYRVFIIDEVHMLSSAAFNAFLKTLEEPPAYAIFILATTEKHKVIPTILSRCQIYDFSRITVPDIVEQLQFICRKEGIEAEPAALNVIAQKADGAMRDALSIFDQITAASNGHITYEKAIDNLNVLDYDYYFKLDESFLTGNVPQALLTYRDIRDHGFDSKFFVNGLAQHLRDLMVASTPSTVSLLEMNDDVAKLYTAEAAKFTPRFYYQALDLCNKCDLSFDTSSNKQLLVELTLIKLCQLLTPSPTPSPDSNQPLKQIKQQATAATTSAPAQTTTAATHASAAAAPQAQAAPQPAPAAKPQPQATAPSTAEPTTAYSGHADDEIPTPPIPDAPAPDISQQIPISPLGLGRRPKATSLGRDDVHLGSVGSSAPSPTAPQRPLAPQAAPQAQAATAVVGGNASFTEDQLSDAWNEYIIQNPTKKIVINAMRASRPQKVNDTPLYEIFVENELQISHIEKEKADILQFLRKRLNNNAFSFNVKITDKAPAPHTWTQREIMADMIKKSPDFAKMVNDLKLRLA